jgi:uncharacterized OB-fold protein
VSDGLFRDHGDGTARLLASRCGRCGRYAFPSGEICPYCSAEECEPAELGPRGLLWLFTAVLRPPPGYKGKVPFGFGIVELEEGLRVVTRLTEPDVSRLARGQAMRLVLERLHVDEDGREVVTYAFAPADEK